MDKLRIKNGSIIQVVGPSGSGKTYFTCALLANKNIYQHPIREIYWHSGVAEGEIGETLKKIKRLRRVHYVLGFPKDWLDRPQQHDVVVIDDLFEEVNKNAVAVNQLFTKIARHRQVTVLFLTQNLFHQGGKHRTRNINTQNLVIFKNPRDKTVIDFLARQAYPGNRNFLMDAFHDATHDKPHGYLFIDFTQECPDSHRVRTDILNRYGPTIYRYKRR